MKNRTPGGGSPKKGLQPTQEPALKTKQESWKRSLAFVKVCTDDHFNFIVSVAFLVVIFAGIAEVVSPTAYGKFGGSNSFAVPPRIGWWLMELPVTVMFIYAFFIKGGSQAHELVPRIMALVMCGHYMYRGWFYPFNIVVAPGQTSNFSLVPAVGGWLVTSIHGYLNGRWFAEHGKHLNKKWLSDLRFWIGLTMYYSGFIMIMWHDSIMRNLRSTPGPRYRIPYGGLFDYATSAHYFVELWAWLGFAILSWGPNGLFIFAVSFVNLVPRAVTNHYWYIEKFGDSYPSDRAYLIPFVW